VIDRARFLTAFQAGLRQVVGEPDHPVRLRIADAITELPARLRADRRLAERVEAAKRDFLSTPMATHVVEDAAAALHRAVLADIERPRSEGRDWIVERLDRAPRALAAAEGLRAGLDRWAKTRVLEAVERYHERIAEFIENGVRALGPDGAVRLIEEHAGDDLQYIRVNGTVVGGLAGGLLHAIRLALGLAWRAGTALFRRPFSRKLSFAHIVREVSMSRPRFLLCLAILSALVSVALTAPVSSQTTPTPKSGGVLNMMLREDLSQGFSIHETSTISTVWPAMP